MTRHIQAIGTGTKAGQDPPEARRSRKILALAGLLVTAAMVGVAFGWWNTTGQSVAGDVPDSPGVGRQVKGLHILDAYLVPDTAPGAYSLLAALETSSGGGDQLVAVSVGGGAATGLPSSAGETARATGLDVGSNHLLRIGPETGATHVTVTGVTGSAVPGSFVTATFTFSRRGPISFQVPVWATVSGPAGPDGSSA